MKEETRFGLDDELRDPMMAGTTSVVSYVNDKIQEWENHIESNYREQWAEFTRIFRGRWEASDRTRNAERSRIVTPASQQAVESSVCEIEEATFGNNKSFDIEDDMRDQSGPQDVEGLKKMLSEEFRRNKIRSSVCEVLVNAAVTGTGVAEVVTEQVQRKRLGTQEVMEGALTAHGVYTENKVAVTLRPVQLKNFYIDPVATSVETAHGCVIDEYVSEHSVHELQRKGVYKKGFVGTAAPDMDIEADEELPVYAQLGKVRIQKYFGLVPRIAIELANMDDDELEDHNAKVGAGQIEEDMGELVEAIVVIANEGVLMKAEESPYMMGDRPVVAFQWDIVPGMFWGKGIIEKGYNSQKALDAEIRARIDALALTVHPMMGIDATRIPRGHKPEVRAGRNILTNGSPKDVLMPFKLGDVSQITFAQAAELQKMVQQSTGAVDGGEFAQGMGSNNKTGATSMALGSIIKRQKRTLVGFQENFWIPFVEKAAWRYMQFDPEGFPVKDYNFVASSSLGIMAREYEVSQLTQLLQTTSDQSPLYPVIVSSIVGKMNIENREQMIATLQEAMKVSPEEQQRKQEAHQMEVEHKKGVTKYAHAQAYESQMRGESYKQDAAAKPMELKIAKLEAITRNITEGSGDDSEFEKRLKIAEVALREREQNRKDLELEESVKARQALTDSPKEPQGSTKE